MSTHLGCLCQVIETKSLMGHVVNGLSDLVPKVQVAAIRCLHSLSRSVRQLRTSFQDQEVWKPIRPVCWLFKVTFPVVNIFVVEKWYVSKHGSSNIW